MTYWQVVPGQDVIQSEDGNEGGLEIGRIFRSGTFERFPITRFRRRVDSFWADIT